MNLTEWASLGNDDDSSDYRKYTLNRILWVDVVRVRERYCYCEGIFGKVTHFYMWFHQCFTMSNESNNFE